MRPAGSPQDLERRRHRAMDLLQQGHSPKEVAQWVGVDRRSVRRWKATFTKSGESALQAHPAPGRSSRLPPEQRKALEEELLKGPQAAGFPSDLWTCARVAQLIERQFGVAYHPDHVGRLLHALGWSPRGHTPLFFKQTRTHRKVSAITALRRRVPGLPVVPGCQCRCGGRPGFSQPAPDRVARTDRGGMGQSDRPSGHIRSSERLEGAFLPPYAPELNPVEYVWSYLKKNPLANRSPDTLEDLHRLTATHARELKGRSNLLRSFLRHSPLFCSE